jgi:hypothetical protein
MLTFFVVASLALIAGCSDDTSDPLSPKQRDVIGSWQLDIAEVDEDLLEVSYRFDRDGGALNQVSGEFLKQLRGMDELGEVDFGELENVDGGNVKWTGEWKEIGAGDSLEVVFETITVELFGRLPIIGKVTIPVYLADLADDVVTMRFGCAVTAGELTLSGRSVAEAISLDGISENETAALGGPAQAAVGLVLETLQAQLPTTEPSFTLTKQ